MQFIGILRNSCFRGARNFSKSVRCIAISSASQQLLVSHVLLKDKIKGAEIINELEKQLDSGVAFSELAQEYSECSTSGKRGGQLGWLQRGSYFPEFEEAAFKAEVGRPVRALTPVGLHLILVQESREVSEVQQMEPSALLEMLSNPALREDVQFIDVREEWEAEQSRLPYFKLYPLSTFEQWKITISSKLDFKKETVVLCHHGVRSMQMSNFLVSEAGFSDVKNVTGGIHAYSIQADSTVPQY
ncbi:hypothetical protein CEUSTIGMA_g7498.t1 [Chlamydomonas eustigma]|uniref:Peptidyl-prolyl cis-trans isomerase n=1 Tax=Chlamydomonas eustigma TaxID=1157962 RepID=A0A250XAZ5_9CHLO|nr:hypothetical protein CEUSTIGMA_g7498.t1 [Chlamydomonas eustigma]|eukprot:GAX80059.1 hypothetical protein CEUSTIGMA_g7498.t1 [Chlamydomonas eustigma]